MGRAPCCDKSKVKRGPWSAEEDNTLKNYLHEHGTTGSNWITLPTKAGLNRCGKSCRLRWMNYLRPDIKRGSFTEEEDIAICNLFSRIGSRWSVIASQLLGRTDNDVKNYWNTKLKKKLARNNIVTTRKTSDHNIALFSAPVPAEVVTPNGAPETASSCLGNTSTLPYAANIGLMHGFNQPKQAFASWCDHFSDSRPMEVSDFGSTSDSNSFSVPLSHQEVSSLPCSSSNLAHQLDEYHYSLWSGYEGLNRYSEFLMGFGFESPPSDHFLQGDFGY